MFIVHPLTGTAAESAFIQQEDILSAWLQSDAAFDHIFHIVPDIYQQIRRVSFTFSGQVCLT